MIEITKTTNGFAIKFPFELKDAFRKSFPTAKWNALKKVWEVGPRSGSRLEQWATEVQQVAADLSTLEERLLEEKEITALHAEIERIQTMTAASLKEINALGKKEDRLRALHTKLEADREKFDAVAAKLEASKAKAASALREILEIVNAVVDMDAIENARKEMAYWHRQATRVGRNKFDEAQAVVIEEREKLEKAGWGLSGLDFMARANFNRPDRDHVDFMPSGAMLDFYKAEEN